MGSLCTFLTLVGREILSGIRYRWRILQTRFLCLETHRRPDRSATQARFPAPGCVLRVGKKVPVLVEKKASQKVLILNCNYRMRYNPGSLYSGMQRCCPGHFPDLSGSEHYIKKNSIERQLRVGWWRASNKEFHKSWPRAHKNLRKALSSC